MGSDTLIIRGGSGGLLFFCEVGVGPKEDLKANSTLKSTRALEKPKFAQSPMLTEDDLKMLKQMIEEVLDARGINLLPSPGALRTQRYRERKASQNVTRKRHKTSPDKGQGVTKASQPSVTPSAETWAAYSAAYLQRYGVEPTRNASVNGRLAQFVTRVPVADAPQIAAFFVRHNKTYYVSCRHDVGALLRDAEGLRTEWLSGRTVTETEARQADRTQATGNAFAPLIAEAQERAKRGTH